MYIEIKIATDNVAEAREVLRGLETAPTHVREIIEVKEQRAFTAVPAPAPVVPPSEMEEDVKSVVGRYIARFGTVQVKERLKEAGVTRVSELEEGEAMNAFKGRLLEELA